MFTHVYCWFTAVLMFTEVLSLHFMAFFYFLNKPLHIELGQAVCVNTGFFGLL